MKTAHRVISGDAGERAGLPAESVELVVTSPPYPMIEMWDACFAAQDPRIGEALAAGKGWEAFEGMHRVLDRAWAEVRRVLVPGGLACINIGDAVRTLAGDFVLYPNHARALVRLAELGLQPLPAILWRKQTNAPNKFMGSGMLPPGAYVTLEHEHVLIVRNGGKRRFEDEAQKVRRRESAYFWEERNAWFSDVWMDLKGTGQDLLEEDVRSRSGAYPFELPYRLISMFSVKGDTVLDPFLGTGTTALAAMAAARSSVGIERDEGLRKVIAGRFRTAREAAAARIRERLEAHLRFVEARFETHGPFVHHNAPYGFPVVTGQETELLLNPLLEVRASGEHSFEAEHSEEAGPAGHRDWSRYFAAAPAGREARPPRKKAEPLPQQLDLLDGMEERS